MTIDFKACVELKHINVRKEGPEDDKVTAIDIKLTADISAKLIDDLLCVDEEKGRAIGAELKASYFQQAARNLEAASKQGGLFDDAVA